MTNKYYTPELEEFHVGFEYEYKLFEDLDVWEKMSFGLDIPRKHEFCNPEIVATRVKYLDEEDILQSGFEEIADREKWSYLYGRYRMNFSEDKSLTLREEDNKWTIAITDHYDYEGHNELPLNIKNKSELIKLIKQLGL